MRCYSFYFWMAILISAVIACGQIFGTGHYSLAYWREVGYYENSNNHSMFFHVFDENGNAKSGVQIRTTWDVLLGTTDANGFCEVPLAVQNDYDAKCVDGAGSTSDVAYTMTTGRWPNWGHYSYEVAFMYKSNISNPGTFDTSLIGTLNLRQSNETDAPCTKSLTYYNLNPLNWQNDSGLGLGNSSSYFGQTFVANANRIVACKIQGTIGWNQRMRWSAQILEGGPNGTPIGPVKTTREMVSDEYWPILIKWGINEVPVTPGNVYFLKVWKADGGSMNTYRCGNNYANGVYYEGANPNSSYDLKGLIVAATGGAPPATLQNPGFEEGFQPSGVAKYWTSFVVQGTPQFLDEQNFVRSGLHAQKWWTSWETHDAGIYQQISVTQGKSYTFSAWSWRYDPWNNGADNYINWVGVDPQGGTNPNAASVVWSSPQYSWGIWTKQSATAVAQKNIMTVFLRGRARLPGSAMVTEVDDCELVLTPTTGYIFGHVTDANSIRLSNVTVSTSPGGYSAISGPGGAYTISDVPPGTYAVTASKAGYNPQTVPGVVVSAGQTTNCDFSLTGPNVCRSVAEAKCKPDGTEISLGNKIISRGDSSAFWIQDEDRTAGIKVIHPFSHSIGTRISMTGVLRTADGERVFNMPGFGGFVSTTAPIPRSLPNRSLGGSALCAYTPGASSAYGPHNVGLLVTCWGRVSESGTGVFYLDDGSLPRTGDPRIKVYCGSLTAPPNGSFAIVSGISSLEPDGQSYKAVLRVFRQTDIISY